MNWKDEIRKRKPLYRLDSNGAFTTCTEDVIADIESLLKEEIRQAKIDGYNEAKKEMYKPYHNVDEFYKE